MVPSPAVAVTPVGTGGAAAFGVAVASADRSTDMADPNVVSCVVRGFQNLSFPAPKDGTVQVIYPLMLSPGE